MKEPSENNGSKFLNTEGGKTKSNTVEIPSISLPKGGGAIKGIDEKFSVNAVNGTSSFSVPLPFSQARGASPALSLSYNSGAGNGVFGLGWSLDLSTIKRKTDKGLPKYIDAIDSDTYLFSGAEDLVPEFEKDSDGSFLKDEKGDYLILEKDSPDKSYKIRRYRPRVEGLFARIERWTHITSGEIKWRIITRENVSTLYGWTDQSRLADPADQKRIFEWFPEFIFDDKGNCSQYLYKKEDGAGFEISLLHNRNRFENGNIKYSNLYLSKVFYGNSTPYLKFGNAFPEEADYYFQTLFDYGEYDQNVPWGLINDWNFRPDAFSDYKPGFEIRTTRLCNSVFLFHVFDELAIKPDKSDKKTLIKSLNFEYDTAAEEDFTFLKTITSYGYIKKQDGSYSHKKLPPTEFKYQKHDWNKEVKTIPSDSLIHAPSGPDEQQFQFTDLYNEGLSGILTEQAAGWYYKHNLGEGKFDQAKLVSLKPSFSGLGNQLQLVDLDGDGGKQLASFNSEPKGYFELGDDNEWEIFRSFKALPNIDFGDSNTRMLDLNGDGKPEVVISDDQVFTWYPSEGRNGYSAAQKTSKPYDAETGPSVVFADEKQTFFLADMSGDGMTDIVRIQNGNICYWPNLGYGKFGAKVAMDNAPFFDFSDSFDPAYIRLADIDGSGTSDIIYLGRNRFTCWKNLSGNRFGTIPFEIDNFPEIHSRSKITVNDLLGNGVACIVWSTPLSKDAIAPLKYIDLMNSRKPHIMVSYKNNMGKEVSVHYTPSTKFYIEDKLAGKPWVTKLHFPVHCVSKTITEDKISGHSFVSEYKYHHGYYDHPEREFRGFGMVEQTDAETFEHWKKGNSSNIVEEPLHQEPVVSKTWHHTGAFLRKDKILDQFSKDYWYNEIQRQGFAVIHHEVTLPEARLVVAPGIDVSILDHFSDQEYREVFRACKGMGLRTEVFAKDAVKYGNTGDARKKELTPYSVATHNCVIELLQPRGKNKHAIFAVKESEAINYSYERNPEDPRIAHNLNIKLDEYGNVLESASVVYPKFSADLSLPAETQLEQNKTAITYTQNQFTNDVISEDTYRLRLPSEVKTFELKGVSKTGTFYSIAEFDDVLSDAKSSVAGYHELEKPLILGKAQKRLIENVCSVYLNDDDLKTPLALHELKSLAIPYENYQLAYSPELLADIFGPINLPDSKVNNALMTEGKFTSFEGDNNWWIRSGTKQFITGTETVLDAQNRFYVPVSYTDPYGSKTKVKYYGSYYLFIEESEDELQNKSKVEVMNFRTLSPQRMKDMNNNLSEVIVDELGIVKAMAIMGKGAQADELTGLEEISENEQTDIDSFFTTANTPGVCNSDDLQAKAKLLLKHATTRFIYDFETYSLSGKPAVVTSITRETHYRKENGNLNPGSKIQLNFEYTNGLGKIIMKKVQAEPGQAFACDGAGNILPVTTTPFLRWIGNGRTIHNNKGNPVKHYETYFSVSPKFEDEKELVECGVSPIMYYDAMGRMVKAKMPDGTLSIVEFDSWKQKIYDANDTISEPECTWFINRTSRLIDAELIAAGKDPAREKIAADKASKHANTPNCLYYDTLGRPVLSVEHNKNVATDADEYYFTKIKLDIEGNLRTVIDARQLPENANKGNEVMQYKYDMLGHKVYQNSMDTGQRWLLENILGNPLRTWDERNHEFQYDYDALHRPLQSKVTGDDGTAALSNIFDRIFYGESEIYAESKNLRGKVIKHYDTGGVVFTPEYDFKGNPASTTRQLFKDYKSVANWVNTNLVTDIENEPFIFTNETDALGRIIKQTAPDGNIISPTYNSTGLLEAETVLLPGEILPKPYIKNVGYNEKGQRQKIIYGNDVTVRFYYDKETFRLKRLESKRLNSDVLQDLYYTYDPVGNVIFIKDEAIPVSFFANSIIEPLSEYKYDALYRLAEATGRENNAALSYAGCDNWNDKQYLLQLNPGDPMAVRNYTQTYLYDQVGNILKMKHKSSGGDWTRTYEYETANNRLKSTHIGDNGNPSDFTKYKHHAKHGFLEELPHLEKISWNFKEEVILTTRQHCTEDNTPVTTYYQYDGKGQRIRKITENQAPFGSIATKKEERIYISGYEIYKKYTGAYAGLERVSLSLLDEGYRFSVIETRNNVDDGTEKQLVRYQLHNHLGSAAMELDGTPEARLISYEEYHPFGTTAYQAVNREIKSANKRYRYTGMERDEETGMEYHSARYYLPWLGRWLSSDPIGIGDGVNLYRYCNNSPLVKSDKLGKQSSPGDTSPVRITPFITQITPLDISGQLQFHNLLSSERSVSGNLGLTTGIRSGFGLTMPALSLNTSGFVDATASARVDTSSGSGRLSMRAGAIIGDTSGFHLTTVGSASLKIAVPGEIPISQAVPTFTSALPGASGDLAMHGALQAGSFSLAEFRASASMDSGRFRGTFDAHSIANIGRLHLDASGTIDASGRPSISNVSATADVNAGLVSFSARGSGTGNADGSLSYSATGNLRILGLPSLSLRGSGTASSAGADFRGTFSGAGPLFTSYVFGNFDLSTTSGISARAGVLGITYTPGVSVTDTAPPSPGMLAIAGDPKSPWTPGGLTLGASFFQYSQGNVSWISAGFMPDLSSNFLRNPQFGITAQGHF